jgi:hypothetical protein
MTCQTDSCPKECPRVFANVRAYPLHQGVSLVTWELLPGFTEAGPYEFQLQWSQYPVDDSEAWEDVGEPVVDTLSAYDEEKRQFGVVTRSHYRVKLTTGAGTHYSRPTSILQQLNFRQQLLFKEVLRTERLRFETSPNAARGYLLKRKTSGETCTTCYDPLSRRSNSDKCRTCYGTGFLGGYFLAAECVWAEFLPQPQQRSANDESVGTTENQVRPVRVLNIPQVFSNDIWVHHNTDLRYVVNEMAAKIEIGGMPVVLEPCGFRLAELTDVIYHFPVEDMLR